MAKYEYFTAVLDGNACHEDDSFMNEKGDCGWRLVAVAPHVAERKHVAYFERELPPEPSENRTP
jgi:hypothetical protein